MLCLRGGSPCSQGFKSTVCVTGMPLGHYWMRARRRGWGGWGVRGWGSGGVGRWGRVRPDFINDACDLCEHSKHAEVTGPAGHRNWGLGTKQDCTGFFSRSALRVLALDDPFLPCTSSVFNLPPSPASDQSNCTLLKSCLLPTALLKTSFFLAGPRCRFLKFTRYLIKILQLSKLCFCLFS